MNVNEHERLSNITLRQTVTQHFTVTEESTIISITNVVMEI